MPHITLLCPFVPRSSFADVLPDLGAACAEVAPFPITLARFDLFAHGRRGATLFLAPEPAAPLVALQTRLWEAAPAYDDTRRHASGFTPHLSVGQARGSAEALALCGALALSWQPLTFTAEAIQLIWRGEPPDDVFRVAHTLPHPSAAPPPQGSHGARGPSRRRQARPPACRAARPPRRRPWRAAPR